jgi:hypothetical protein
LMVASEFVFGAAMVSVPVPKALPDKAILLMIVLPSRLRVLLYCTTYLFAFRLLSSDRMTLKLLGT